MNARDYYLGMQRTVHGAAFVLSSDLRFEEVDEHVGYIEGVLLLIGDFQLYIYDNFRLVYEEFTAGMSRTQKVQLLVAYCERRGETEQLLARVERANPYQYEQFRDRLHN